MWAWLNSASEIENDSSTSRSRCSSVSGRRKSKNGGEEQHAQRQPQIQRVDVAAERARVAARHRPRDLEPRPLFEHAPGQVVDLDLRDLLLAVLREVADLPVEGGLQVGAAVGARVFGARGADLREPFGDREHLVRRQAAAGGRHVRGRHRDRRFGVGNAAARRGGGAHRRGGPDRVGRVRARRGAERSPRAQRRAGRDARRGRRGARCLRARGGGRQAAGQACEQRRRAAHDPNVRDALAARAPARRAAGGRGRQAAAAGSPKCDSATAATSRIAHCAGGGSGSFAPWITSAPSESLACSEPWLPPPTCAWRPQSANSQPRRRRQQDLAGGRAHQRRPDAGERVGVVGAEHDAVADLRAEDRRLSPDVPAARPAGRASGRPGRSAARRARSSR